MSQKHRLQDIEAHSRGLLGILPQADLGLIAAGAVVFGAQALAPTQGTQEMQWYKGLRKPTWTPPNKAFPIVWTSLKVAQTVSLWLLWKSREDKKELLLPLSLYAGHLCLGNYWNQVFFKERRMQDSLPVMAAFWGSTLGVIFSFLQCSQVSGLLIVPTQVWVTIASALNWEIVRLNKDK